jgi:biopolymer transport protein TolR
VAAAGDGSGDRLNTELNLVPFIDLLSSLVLFLLVTTIWMQVGTITVSADSHGKAAQPESAKVKLFIHLTSRGYDLRMEGARAGDLVKTIPLLNGQYDNERLLHELKSKLGSRLPNMAAVSAVDEVSYKNVVMAVDIMKAVGFPAVALATD